MTTRRRQPEGSFQQCRVDRTSLALSVALQFMTYVPSRSLYPSINENHTTLEPTHTHTHTHARTTPRSRVVSVLVLATRRPTTMSRSVEMPPRNESAFISVYATAASRRSLCADYNETRRTCVHAALISAIRRDTTSITASSWSAVFRLT